jgi:Asp-tRNA(Asn)/Glu-tRNA(Gln) amidotransferase B subunit
LVQVTDKSEIETSVRSVLSENKREVEQYFVGKEKLLVFLQAK